MKTFRVSYDIKGTRIVDVAIEDKDLPSNWEELEPSKQDEILYERQQYSVLHLEDIDYGKAESIIELKNFPQVVR